MYVVVSCSDYADVNFKEIFSQRCEGVEHSHQLCPSTVLLLHSRFSYVVHVFVLALDICHGSDATCKRAFSCL